MSERGSGTAWEGRLRSGRAPARHSQESRSRSRCLSTSESLERVEEIRRSDTEPPALPADTAATAPTTATEAALLAGSSEDGAVPRKRGRLCGKQSPCSLSVAVTTLAGSSEDDAVPRKRRRLCGKQSPCSLSVVSVKNALTGEVFLKEYFQTDRKVEQLRHSLAERLSCIPAQLKLIVGTQQLADGATLAEAGLSAGCVVDMVRCRLRRCSVTTCESRDKCGQCNLCRACNRCGTCGLCRYEDVHRSMDQCYMAVRILADSGISIAGNPYEGIYGYYESLISRAQDLLDNLERCAGASQNFLTARKSLQRREMDFQNWDPYPVLEPPRQVSVECLDLIRAMAAQTEGTCGNILKTKAEVLIAYLSGTFSHCAPNWPGADSDDDDS